MAAIVYIPYTLDRSTDPRPQKKTESIRKNGDAEIETNKNPKKSQNSTLQSKLQIPQLPDSLNQLPLPIPQKKPNNFKDIQTTRRTRLKM